VARQQYPVNTKGNTFQLNFMQVVDQDTPNILGLETSTSHKYSLFKDVKMFLIV